MKEQFAVVTLLGVACLQFTQATAKPETSTGYTETSEKGDVHSNGIRYRGNRDFLNGGTPNPVEPTTSDDYYTTEENVVHSSGFHYVQGYFFYVNTDEQLSFVQAAQACNNLGMSLISFETQHKYDVIARYLTYNTLNYDYWTSGHKVLGTFIWTGSGRAFNDTNWYTGQPNDNSADICVDFSPTFGWWDNSCTLRWAYICE